MFRAYKISLEKSVLIEIKQNANYWECNYWVNAKKSPLNQSILLNFTEKKHISTYYMCNIIIKKCALQSGESNYLSASHLAKGPMKDPSNW